MKLTNQQIEYVENYIISKDIKWYELQVELTDHMINSMEEFWAEDPELTFHQVKYYAEEKFGKNGFKAIEEERTHILRKEYRRVQWKMIADYLKFPKIFASALTLIVIYKSSFYFEKPVKFIAVFYVFLLIAYIPSVYSYFKNRKINGKRFLQIEISNPMVIGFGFLNLGLNVGNLCKEWIEQYSILRLLYCAVLFLGVLALITGKKIYEKSLSNIKKQYQLN
ncbi:hypothetical protein HNP99_000766 [Flavobacterium sp. 28A]|uniref:hypothetical protein n=1 Tax=Flavobacterium sp. 28A TaxID=2735895 RepID=UPI0015705537|nr:hypothetical protein [Flavobacterium sp. 28A]NRT14426.1 hypothetical protein [Flavobacterium sp. 28A]